MLNPDIDYATALTEEACQGPQGNRRRQTQALGQQAQHLKTLSHTGPDEDAAHETEDIDAKAHDREARRWSGKHAHAPVMRATHYTPARRAGGNVLLPRSQNAAWTERQGVIV